MTGDRSVTINRLRGYFERIAQMGWWDGFLCMVANTMSLLSVGWVSFDKLYLVSLPIQDRRLLPPGRGKSIEVRRIETNDPIVVQFREPAEEYRHGPHYFAAGAYCFAALKEQKFAGFIWLQRGPRVEHWEGFRARFVPMPAASTVWDFDLYVEPAERNTLVFARLWDEVNEFLRTAGVRWSVSLVSAFTPDSVRSHASLGAYAVGCVWFIWAGPLQITFKDSAPRFHISFSQKTIPEIPVRAEWQKAFPGFICRPIHR